MSNIPRLLRLPEVLERFPVSRSTWLKGVRCGVYPAPLRLSARVLAWREEDIEALYRGLDDKRASKTVL